MTPSIFSSKDEPENRQGDWREWGLLSGDFWFVRGRPAGGAPGLQPDLGFSFLGRFWFWLFHTRSGHASDRRPTEGAHENGSCGVPLLETLKEFALGVLHRQRRFGIGLALGDALQFRQRDPGPQVFLALRQFLKHLERCCPP